MVSKEQAVAVACIPVVTSQCESVLWDQQAVSGLGRRAGSQVGCDDPFIGRCIIDYYDIGIVHVREESDEASNVSVPDTSPSFCDIDSLLSIHLPFNLVKATLILQKWSSLEMQKDSPRALW